MGVRDELLKVDAQGVFGHLGHHEVFSYATVTPAHRFAYSVKIFDESHVVLVVARDSWSDDLASWLLDQAPRSHLPDPSSTRLRVLVLRSPEPWPFETVVILPPIVAERFKDRSATLAAATYWVFPAFSSEFTDGDPGGHFWHQIGRKDGWRIHVVVWNRTLKTRRGYE